MTVSHRLRVKPGARIRLADLDPDNTHGFEKGDELDAALAKNIARFRNLAVSQVLVETLEALDMRFPKPTVDLSRITLD